MEAEDLHLFSEIVGAAGVLTAPEDRVRYETPARYATGRAAAIIRPRSVDELSRVLAAATQRNIPVIPQSGNTGLVLGSVPDNSGTQIVVSLDRLRAPLAIDPANRSAQVGAGVRLSELNDAAAEHDLFLPIDLGADPMVGGMVATNTGGARFIRHGGMRGRVLGLTVVLADPCGTVLRLGSGLRKDNSQLDLRQLFIGSAGALGIVAEATIDLSRRPRQTAAALIVPSSVDAVIPLLERFEADVGDFLTAFEGMSKSAMEAALGHVPNLRNPFTHGTVPDYALIIELTSVLQPETISLEDLLQRMLMSAFEAEEGLIADALFGDVDQIWQLRHGLSEGIRELGTVIGFDLSFRRNEVFRFRARASAEIARNFPDFRICDFGHVGDGGVHFNVVIPRGKVDPGDQAALVELVTTLAVEEFAGSFCGEHGIGRSNQELYDRHIASELRGYAGRVTAAFASGVIGAPRFGRA